MVSRTILIYYYLRPDTSKIIYTVSLRKYQSVEKTEVLPPQEQQKISSGLHAIGKTSAANLDEEERRKALDSNRVV